MNAEEFAKKIKQEVDSVMQFDHVANYPENKIINTINKVRVIFKFIIPYIFYT